MEGGADGSAPCHVYARNGGRGFIRALLHLQPSRPALGVVLPHLGAERVELLLLVRVEDAAKRILGAVADQMRQRIHGIHRRAERLVDSGDLFPLGVHERINDRSLLGAQSPLARRTIPEGAGVYRSTRVARAQSAIASNANGAAGDERANDHQSRDQLGLLHQVLVRGNHVAERSAARIRAVTLAERASRYSYLLRD